jgi:hypothetical protein
MVAAVETSNLTPFTLYLLWLKTFLNEIHIRIDIRDDQQRTVQLHLWYGRKEAWSMQLAFAEWEGVNFLELPSAMCRKLFSGFLIKRNLVQNESRNSVWTHFCRISVPPSESVITIPVLRVPFQSIIERGAICFFIESHWSSFHQF